MVGQGRVWTSSFLVTGQVVWLSGVVVFGVVDLAV